MPIKVKLPCGCGTEASVSSRQSKQQERPRNHRCPACGKVFGITLKQGSFRKTLAVLNKTSSR